MKRIIICMAIILAGSVSIAQETSSSNSNVSVDYSINIVSRYIWRGLLYNSSPNIQPDLSLSVGNFSFGSWASYSFNQNYAEVDLYITYAIGGFSATLFDYYNENEADMASIKYFKWDRKITGHALEGTIAWNGTESFPLRALAATFFYGNDRDENGNQYYSTYFEVGYPINLNDYTIDLFLGGTPAKGLYHTNANIVNLGLTVSKDVKVSNHFSLPLSASFIVNPAKEDVYFVVGLTLK